MVLSPRRPPDTQELVDKNTIHAIRAQFYHMTNKRKWKVEEARVLDSKLVFLEMCEQGRIKDRPSIGDAVGGALGHALNSTFSKRTGNAANGLAPEVLIDENGLEIQVVEMNVQDGGYAEWLEEHWLRMVREGNEGELKLKPSFLQAWPRELSRE